MEHNLPITPASVDEFSKEWICFVMRKYFQSKYIICDNLIVNDIKVTLNSCQGILSTTFIVDFNLNHEESKSIFVKVPLKGNSSYNRYNKTELTVLQDVLPKLQKFLDRHCNTILRLPMPDVLYCYYDGRGISDVFVMENLLEAEFENFSLQKCLDEEHLRSILGCLAQLHGSGLVYGQMFDLKLSFPTLDHCYEINELIQSKKLQEHFRKHFRPFLHFLEMQTPSLAKHTSYIKKMYKHIMSVIRRLNSAGIERLHTLCHGDAKPNNFLFRKIEIDIEDLECTGLESILIDWQSGFIGSVANDLMWAFYPFLEVNPGLLQSGISYYFCELKSVIESFNYTLKDLQIPDNEDEFVVLLQKSFVNEFLLATLVKPILSIKEPHLLKAWYRQEVRRRNQKKCHWWHFSKPVDQKMPDIADVFQNERFSSFCEIYFKIATLLGAFEEFGKIYFDVVKDSLFKSEEKQNAIADSDEEEEQDKKMVDLHDKSKIFGLGSGILLGIGFYCFYITFVNKEK